MLPVSTYICTYAVPMLFEDLRFTYADIQRPLPSSYDYKLDGHQDYDPNCYYSAAFAGRNVHRTRCYYHPELWVVSGVLVRAVDHQLLSWFHPSSARVDGYADEFEGMHHGGGRSPEPVSCMCDLRWLWVHLGTMKHAAHCVAKAVRLLGVRPR
jgi:hypothetical protein